MKLYLFCCQDCILKGNSTAILKAGDIFNIQFDDNEIIEVYPLHSSGVILLNKENLISKQHTQINFYTLSADSILCEIKPFISPFKMLKYNINGSELSLSISNTATYILYNNDYYGSIYNQVIDIKFNKQGTTNGEYGIVTFSENKYIIVFNNRDIVYCGNIIDYETTRQHIKIYSHNPNIFNVGKLTSIDFNTGKEVENIVDDSGCCQICNNSQLINIYFLEAVKCGRYKLAHGMLTSDLKEVINKEMLKQYFKPYDKYIYLYTEDAFIALKNNKVTGIYHLVVKDNYIDNIY